jgi:hypothetical protein
MELWTTRIGHYPESRSENKGNEPENVFYSKMMNNNEYVFVLSERSNVVFVYDVTGNNVMSPKLLQILVSLPFTTLRHYARTVLWKLCSLCFFTDTTTHSLILCLIYSLTHSLNSLQVLDRKVLLLLQAKI